MKLHYTDKQTHVDFREDLSTTALIELLHSPPSKTFYLSFESGYLDIDFEANGEIWIELLLRGEMTIDKVSFPALERVVKDAEADFNGMTLDKYLDAFDFN